MQHEQILLEERPVGMEGHSPRPISLVAFVPFVLSDSRSGPFITAVPGPCWGWVGQPPWWPRLLLVVGGDHPPINTMDGLLPDSKSTAKQFALICKSALSVLAPDPGIV